MKALLALALLALAVPGAAGDAGERQRALLELRQIAAESRRLSRAFNLVHEIVGPSVVSIRTSERQVELTWAGRRVREVEAGEGSGFVVASDREQSWILTNAHVVLRIDENKAFVQRRDGSWAGYDRLRVVLHDNRETEAAYVGVDPPTDLALLRIPIGDLPPIEWGDSDLVHVGDWVVALGYPLGVGYSATAGIVSATDRSTGIYEAVGGFESFIQTDAAINPGNSGGPLVDLSGRIIGVNSNIVSRSGGNIGLGFAIPSNLARRVVEDLRAHGQVRRGLIGVRLEEIDAQLAANLGLPRAQAARIAEVTPYTPAAEAGLQAGDVVLAVNGSPISSIQQFRSRLAVRRIGDIVTLTLWRDGRTRQAAVRLGDPAEINAAFERAARETLARATRLPVLGCRVLPDERGLLIVQVDDDGLAAEGGLAIGDRILAERSLGRLNSAADAERLARLREGVIQVQRGRSVQWLRFRG